MWWCINLINFGTDYADSKFEAAVFEYNALSEKKGFLTETDDLKFRINYLAFCRRIKILAKEF